MNKCNRLFFQILFIVSFLLSACTGDKEKLTNNSTEDKLKNESNNPREIILESEDTENNSARMERARRAAEEKELKAKNVKKTGDLTEVKQKDFKEIKKTENENIRTKIKGTYEYIAPYHNGRAVVRLNGKYGYIDQQGYELVAPQYDFAEDFNESYALARVRIRDKVGFLDRKGQEVIALRYRYVEKFIHGLAHARLIDGEEFYIDMKGNHVCDILDTYHEDLARVKMGSKLGYVDKLGNVVVPIIYSYGTHFSGGMAEVKLNEKHFFINKKGECVKDCE